jgi:hypothetical protein
VFDFWGVEVAKKIAYFTQGLGPGLSLGEKRDIAFGRAFEGGRVRGKKVVL